MNRQAFFNIGVRHILRAGPAFTEGKHKGKPCTVSCYLTEEGTACFLGANLLELWPAPRVRELGDESPESDGSPVFWALEARSKDDIAFVMDCMNAHDAVAGERDWKARFRRRCRTVAKRWGINPSILD